MKPVVLVRRLAAVHGLSARWLALVLGSWVVLGLLSHLGLPRLDPRLEVERRPLESLGTLGLAVPALVHAIPLRTDSGWLTSVSARPVRILRGTWTCAHLLLGATVCGVFASVALPGGISGWQVLGVWSGTWALSAALVSCGLFTAAALAPLAVLAGHSFGLVPWQENLVYNPALVRPLLTAAALLCVLAVGVAAGGPRRWW